jgi:hypothetical protein
MRECYPGLERLKSCPAATSAFQGRFKKEKQHAIAIVVIVDIIRSALTSGYALPPTPKDSTINK